MGIVLKNDYGNGSWSYYSERAKGHRNIPAELGQAILDLQREVRKLEYENATHKETVQVCKDCKEVVEGSHCEFCRGDFGTDEMSLYEYENNIANI